MIKPLEALNLYFRMIKIIQVSNFMSHFFITDCIANKMIHDILFYVQYLKIYIHYFVKHREFLPVFPMLH